MRETQQQNEISYQPFAYLEDTTEGTCRMCEEFMGMNIYWGRFIVFFDVTVNRIN